MLGRLVFTFAAIALANLAHASTALTPSAKVRADVAPVQVFDGFVQSSPATGAAPTRPTELRLWHDARTLFIAIRAFDPEPSAIVARKAAWGRLGKPVTTSWVDR